MSRNPTDKPPRPGKPIGGRPHAPSRPLVEERSDMGRDSVTVVRSVPEEEERTDQEVESQEEPTQLRLDTPLPTRGPVPGVTSLIPGDDSSEHAVMVVPAELAPDARGADSPNETIMLPHRPAMPSQPIAFAAPHPNQGAPLPHQPSWELITGPPIPAHMRAQSNAPPVWPQPPSHSPPHGAPQLAPSHSPPHGAPQMAPIPPPQVPVPPPSHPHSHPPAPLAPHSYPAAPHSAPAQSRPAGPQSSDGSPPSSKPGAAGPGSFSRIFLGNVEKYRGKSSGNVGSASQEAAAVLAESAAPVQQRATGSTLRLRSPLALVEALLLTLLLPTIGWLADRSDPFFLNHHFSWIVVAPLLLGLRHGFAPALASAVVLDGLIAAAWRTQIVPMDRLPGETMVGIAALAMITGQFSDVWKRELVRLDGGFEVLRKQLGEVMRAHFLLELSHDRLEERMGKGTPNLRDALVAVHRSVAMRPGTTLADLSDSIVDIFSTYTMIEVGAVYRVENDRLLPEAVAKIGRPAPLDAGDEQVKEALQTKKLTYIRGGASVEAVKGRSNLLAVVPFVDTRQKLHGMLMVESLPLLAFERRNLEALAILGGRFADAVASGGKDIGVQRGQKKELEIRLRRAIRDLVENDIASTLFVLLVRKGGAASDSIETVLGGTLRALDFPYVERDAVGNYVVYILLPLTDEAGARAFGARIERIVRREGSMPLARAGAFNFHHVLRPDDTVEGVMSKLEAKAKLDEASVEHTIIV
jgi:polysaccharide biosynthesis protein PelD